MTQVPSDRKWPEEPPLRVPDVDRAVDESTPFGYCPFCGARGVLRQIAPGGKDRCEQEHVYWTAMARRRPPAYRHELLVLDTPLEWP